ncbi:MAG TPA: hypothetical protein VGB04_02395 [Allosphingosinicella sp.]|jgi:hypothetical protein
MAKKPAAAPPEYEDRIILFIDFLAFKEIVDETEADPDALRRLIAAMDALAEIGDDRSMDSQRVSQFSDSIVVSYRVDETSGVFWLLIEMAWAVIDLAYRGYLVRGALTRGPLFHTDRHVVGPAMVKAYLMESKEAKFPRVIIDPQLLELAREHRSEQHTPEEEEGYVRHFMKEDSDGRLFFDYVSWDTVVEYAGADDDGYGPYLARLSSVIAKGLSNEEAGVVEKYLWLHRHYQASLDHFAALPADHPYRAQSFENCELIESLPRFTAEIAAAEKKVAAATKQKASAAKAVPRAKPKPALPRRAPSK